ncbi:hypothetical protein [Microbacterium sp. CR_7]|uniref:hypothetical protein n=1 Tax=Microbacterium sp. CR_7 TaxID=3055792 RepID=UPI0035C1C812
MPHVTVLTTGALFALASALAGCGTSSAPAPTPTTAFASEAEAFAEAEKVYRAYNEAGNARNAGLTEPEPQQFLVGEALERDIDAQNTFAANGLSVTGEVVVAGFNPVSADTNDSRASVIGIVCLDVSQVALLDASGVDVTPADRPDVVAQQVTFVGTSGQLTITREVTEDVSSCLPL